MPGKPHDCSIPEEGFTVKDRFGLDSKGPNPAFSSYRYQYRQTISLPGDSHR